MEKQQQIKLLSSTPTCFCSLEYKASLIKASGMAFKNQFVAESFFHFVWLFRTHQQEEQPGRSTLVSTTMWRWSFDVVWVSSGFLGHWGSDGHTAFGLPCPTS